MSGAQWLERVGRMDGAEIMFRARTAAREKAQRLAATLRAKGWHREALASRLLPSAGAIGTSLERLDARDWTGAHRALCEHFHRRVSRFPVSPHALPELADRVRRAFPLAADDAAARADRLVAARFDLLGYQDLDFGTEEGPIDWHYDPVHHRRAPRDWWARVRYLDPALGDHKIIWELNRHQHFLALGRAAWLTGRPAYREAFVEHLESWLRANPPLAGINWASMLELSLRSLSWVWALHFFVEPADPRASAAPWLVDLLLAIDRQLSHVEQNLSLYFSPNTHLTGEALSLYVCGLALPELASAASWVSTGRTILLDQIDRQVLPDGGHVERSTHYLRYTFDFYTLALAMARVTEDPCADRLAGAVDRLASATRLLADVNGRVPHIGDDDGGALFPICGRDPADVRDSLASAATLLSRRDLLPAQDRVPEETLWLLGNQPEWIIRDRRRQPAAGDRALRSGQLAETGYFVSRPRACDHVVIDGGPHGYLNGGHAHADALSLTAVLSGVPLFIDPGTASYTISAEERDRFRSSQMHNTLTLDGRSQSVPAGPFHWRTVANARVDRWLTSPVVDYFEGLHDGYRPLLHRRRVVVVPGGPVLVLDTVEGDASRHRAEVHWHLDPAWRVAGNDQGRLSLRHRSGSEAWIVSLEVCTDVFLGDEKGLGWHSPVYGRVEPATTIRLTNEGLLPLAIVTMFGEGPAEAAPDILWAPSKADRADRVPALLIATPGAEDVVIFGTPGERIEAAGVETDARFLCLRAAGGRQPARAAMLDGRFARSVTTGAPLLPHGRVGDGLLVDDGAAVRDSGADPR